MICKTCGAELEQGAAFCQNCGAKTEEPVIAEESVEEAAVVGGDEQQEAPKKKKSKAPIIIIVVILAVLLLGGLIIIPLLLLVLGGGLVGILAIFGMKTPEVKNPMTEVPNSSYFEEVEEDLPEFEYDSNVGEIIGGIVEEDGVATSFPTLITQPTFMIKLP